MKKLALIIVCLITIQPIYGQSTVTIGIGSSISVGNGSAFAAGYRDGTMLNSGTFNSRSITFDPVATAATSVTQTSFNTNWNASAGANGYRLDVSTDINFGSFVTGYQNLDVGSVTSYSVNSGITTGTTYYYRLRAYDIDGITGYSNVITLITAPAPPVASSATNINESSFRANWAASAGANKYYIDLATDNTFTTMVSGWDNVNVENVVTYTISTNLIANKTYYFRVRAANNYGTSNNSNTITILTAPLPPVVAAATSLAQTSFNANWSEASGATTYYLDVSTVNTFASYVTGYQNKDVGNVTTYSVNANLTAGTTYYYRVRSSNGNGISTNSETVIVLTVPPNPVATAATAITQASFSANWNASPSATKYYIDVATDAAFTSPVAAWTDVDMGNVLTYSVNTNLTPGTTYYYRIRSNNASGTSGNSETITVLTIPAAPTTTAASTITQISFEANWNGSQSATKYYLDVSTDAAFGAGTFVTDYENKDVANVTTFSVNTNLSAGTNYYYRLRAENSTGISNSSNTINLVTIPPNPIAIAANNITESSFNAKWNSSLSATGYRIDVSSDAGFSAGTFAVGFQDKDVANVTSYLINSLSANTTYYYRVRAYNDNGVSGNSGDITQLTAPSIPVATAASAITQTSFDANWNASIGATGYRLDVSTDNGFGAGTFVTGFEDKDIGNVITFSVASYLIEGTTYYYRLRSYNAAGASSNSNSINLETIPEAPIETAASSIAATSFNANWNAVIGADGYSLDVATDPAFGAGTFVTGYQNKNVGNVVTSSVNTNLIEGTTYYYRVRAFNTGGISGNSGVISVSTVSSTPTANAATLVEPTRFTANWSSVTGANGYTLDVSTSNVFGSFVTGYNNIDVGNVTSFEVTGLSRGVTYYYRVRAYNVGGTSGNSNTRSVITLSPAPIVTPATLITTTSFFANWNSSTGATGYYLDVATDNGFTSFVAGFNGKDVANVTTYSVPALTSGTTYYYRVRAYNASGPSKNSSTVIVMTVPDAPVELAASSITNNSFNSNWNASTGANGYYLDVATDNGFTGYVPGYNGKNIGNVTTYSVTGLSENIEYFYRVRAYNTGGISLNSGTVSVTTNPNILSTPSINPASAITATSFNANWNASTGATKYFLDVSTVPNFATFVTDWHDVDVGNVLTYTVNTNLTSGTSYYYRLRAFNASGTSGYSSTVLVKTIPPPPVEQAASSIDVSNFDANWTASTGATGYYIDVATDAGFTSFVSGLNNRDVGNVITYTVTGLTGGTSYYYRVRAYNTGGVSGNSGIIDTTTAAGGTVIATAATSITATSFVANWNAYGGSSGYKLDVSTSSTFVAGSFVAGYENENVGNVTFYTVSGLTGGTPYYYRVTAYNAVPADIGTSGTINVITLPDPPTPGAANSITEFSFDANWNASTSATGYYIDVATNNGFTTFVTGFNNKYVNNVTTYTITGLTGGTAYYYRVRAKNGSGIGVSSSIITLSTIPHQPSAALATALTNNSLTANWSSSTGATGYKLDVSTVSNFGSFVDIYNNLDVGDVLFKSVTGLASGTTYYYRIRSYNGSGESNNSETITSLTLPAAPVSKSATSIAKTSFVANWNSSVGAIEYYLDVATTSSFDPGTYIGGYQNFNVGNSLSYLISGLTRGTTYYYRVRAFNTSGTSGNSGNQSVLTLPPDPSVLSATNIQSTSFTANWNSSTSATGYRLDVSEVSNFASFVGIYNDLDVGNFIAYSVAGLTGGNTYYYRVRAYNATGSSDNSGTMMVLIAPDTPVAIAATSLTGTSFSANWNLSAGADGYKIDVSTDALFSVILAEYDNRDAGSATTFAITGLNNGTNYYYRVKAYSGVRASENSNTITVLTKPAAPVSASASQINESSFKANWSSSTSATKYYLDVATDNGFTIFVAGFNNKDVGDVSTFSITGLSANTNYFYRVRSENASGVSGNSGTINVLSAPAVPVANAATSISNTSFNANWNSSLGASGYKLDVSTVSNFASFVGIYNNKDVGNVTTYSVSGLSGSTNYYYRLRAYNGNGISGNSGTINLLTAIDPSGVPTSSAATDITQTSFSANWTAVAGAAGYRLDVSTDWNFGAGNFVTNFENKDVGNLTTFSVTSLTNGTTYYYRVRSYNASGTSGNSGSITILTLPETPSSTPATSITSTSFTANWNSSAGATGYNLDVATDNGFTNFVAGFNDKDVSNVTSFSVTSLSGGTSYYYRVRGYNESGSSGNSGIISLLTQPTAPTATAATSLAETSFNANWNIVTGADGYRLDVSTSAGFTAGTFVTGYQDKDVSNVITYSLSGLTGGINYYYRVRAYNTTGTSSNSNSINTFTIPQVPTATSATSITGTSFSANWNSVTGASKYFLDVSTDVGFGAGTFVLGYQDKDVSNVVTYSVTGLSVNTDYYFRVRSNNSSGTSANSNIITLMTSPPTPTATDATSPGENYFTANWNLVAGATGYFLDVSNEIGFGPGTFEAGYNNKDVGNVSSFDVTGISSGITHYYRLRSYNDGGTSGNSNIIKVLGVPFAAQATAVTQTSFSANWNTVAGSVGFRLDVSTDINFVAGSFLAGFQNKDVGNVTTFPISGLTPNLTHYYRVRAYDADGTSGNSNTIIVKNLPEVPVATAATNIGQTNFTANWNLSANGALGYLLDVATDAAFTNFVTGYQNKAVYNVSSFLVDGVIPGLNYHYRVRAYNSSGTTNNSNTISLITIPDSPVAVNPSDVSETSFSANWNLTAGAAGYRLDVSTNSTFMAGTFIVGYEDLDVNGVTTFSVTGLTGGTNYYYRVRAYNVNGTGTNSNIITVPTIPVAAVATLASAITEASFTANWDRVNGVTNYYIDVASDIGFTSFISGYNNRRVGNVGSYNVLGLSANSSYYYRVRAGNEYGSSGNSNTVTVLTAPAIPVAYSATSIGETSFHSTWNSSTGATAYFIDVSTNNNFTSFLPGYQNRNVGNVTTFKIDGVSPGNNYFYRVRSYNNSGTSNNSNTIDLITIPAAPLALNSTNISQTNFSASWNSSAGATGYFLDVSNENNFASFIDGYQNKDVGDVTTFDFAGALPGAPYYYRVRAYNVSGTSGNSNTILLIAVPAAPLAVNSSNITQNSFSANWNLSVGAAGYLIDISIENDFRNFIDGCQNRDVGNVTTFNLDNSSPGILYYYRVRAYNNSGISDNSNTISLITIPPAPLAVNPTNITQGGFFATWNPSSGADRYFIDISTTDSFTSFVDGYQNKEVGNVTTYSVIGLAENTTYYYRLSAVNGSGTSNYSNIIAVVGIPATLPATSISENSFKANWKSVVGATTYYLDVATDNEFTEFVPGYNDRRIGITTSFVITALFQNKEYYYRVRSSNQYGVSANSNTTIVFTSISRPTSLPATLITENSFKANWNLSAGAVGYLIDVSTDIGFTNILTGYQNKDVGNTTTCSVTGLESGSTYYYRLRSFSARGISGNSGIITVFTTLSPPIATAETLVTEASFSANWNAVVGATGYYLDVATDPGFINYVNGFQNKNTGNVTIINVTGIVPGNNYYYRVRAFNSIGTSNNSNVINVLTIPSSTVANSASLITATSFNANWNSVTGAESYRLDVSTTSNFAEGTFVSGYEDLNISGETTYSVVGLTGGTSYYYRIRAYNVNGAGNNSNIIAVLTIPAAAEAKPATMITESSFISNWNAIAGASGYSLDVSTDFRFTNFVAGYQNKNTGNVTSFIITGLTGGNIYYYRVRSYNASGMGANSNEINLITVPMSPVAVAATLITETSFTANWNPVVGATSYRLDVSTNSYFMNGTFVDGYENKEVAGTTNLVSGLIYGTTYYYRVRAFNISGTGNNSNVIIIQTIPLKPVATEATVVTESSFYSNWNAVVNAVGYYLDVSTNNEFSNFFDGYYNINVSNLVTYPITGLRSNTIYYYRVRSYNLSGTSENSNIVMIITKPMAPTSVTATNIGQTNFTANWSSTDVCDGYAIDVAFDSEFVNFVIGYENKNVGKVLSYAVTGLTPGLNYFYRVRSVNSFNCSNNSNIINLLLSPENPLATEATEVQQKSFIANWTGSVGAEGYKLDVSYDEYFSSGKFVPGYFDKDVFNQTSFSVNENLKKGSQYYYRVRAYNSSGLSGNSNTIVLNTVPNAEPILSWLENTALIYNEGEEPVKITDSLVVGDPDDAILFGAEIQITDNYLNSEDVLYFTNQNGISGNWNSITGRMILSGSSTTQNYQTAIRSITYRNTSIKPDSKIRTVSFMIKDSTSFSSTLTRRIKINSVNSPPILSGIEPDPLVYKIKQGKIQLTQSLVVTDIDDDISGYVIIEITENYLRTEDFLSCPELAGLTILWDQASGKLIISGSMSLISFQDVIRSVQYSNSSIIPTVLDRTISITYNDGKENSNTITRKIKYSSVNSIPIIFSIEKNKLLYGLNSQPLCISDSLKMIDDDNLNLFGGEIKISENYLPDEDILLFDGTEKIRGLFNQITGALTLVGQETVENYCEAIMKVMYKNLKGGLATKTLKKIEIRVWDGMAFSNSATRIIDVDGIPTGIEVELDGIPSIFELYQNFPNPFNPSTRIAFDLPKACVVTIEVFDLLGRKVTSLINEQKNAGRYSIRFNNSGLSSGIYFYRINAVDSSTGSNVVFTKTCKMILMK